MSITRRIVKIDEERCNGCGECVPNCAEGAIAVIDGKARLVSEVYCDGLGACLGTCPQDAITVEEREAEAFDPQATEQHSTRQKAASHEPAACSHSHPGAPADGCPGALAQSLQAQAPASGEVEASDSTTAPSQLGNWPVQLKLAPVTAPYYQQARLLIAADCVPFAFADFHRSLLRGRTLLVGCPKLDDADLYRQKLTEILRQNDVASIDIAHMEVPCCHGLVRLVQAAVEACGKDLPVKTVEIGLRGEIL